MGQVTYGPQPVRTEVAVIDAMQARLGTAIDSGKLRVPDVSRFGITRVCQGGVGLT